MRISDSGGTIQVMADLKTPSNPEDVQRAIQYIADKLEKGYKLTIVSATTHNNAIEFILNKEV